MTVTVTLYSNNNDDATNGDDGDDDDDDDYDDGDPIIMVFVVIVVVNTAGSVAFTMRSIFGLSSGAMYTDRGEVLHGQNATFVRCRSARTRRRKL